MARPVVVVVDAEDASRQALARELEGRYGADYRIVSSASPEEALAGLEQLRGEGADVPLVLADQWMPVRTGAQFLARVRELYPTARRVPLITWGDQSAPAPIVEAAALGQIDFYLPKPVWSPDEQFHRVWVPRTSSSLHDQAIFVDQTGDASLPSDAVLLKIDRFG